DDPITVQRDRSEGRAAQNKNRGKQHQQISERQSDVANQRFAPSSFQDAGGFSQEAQRIHSFVLAHQNRNDKDRRHAPGQSAEARNDPANEIELLFQRFYDQTHQPGKQRPHQNSLEFGGGKFQSATEEDAFAFQGGQDFVVKRDVEKRGAKHRDEIQ